jgi:site-specific recombinase XerC
VAIFLRSECERWRAVATMRRCAAAVCLAHRAAQLTDRCKSEPVRLALRAIVRAKGTDQKQAAPLGHREADEIVASIDAPHMRPKDVRDLALMLVGRDLLARASELVSVLAESIAFDTDGAAVIMLRRIKTSTESVPYQIGVEAATALARWPKLSGITVGPVFRSLTKGGRVKTHALGVRDVSKVLKGLARRSRITTNFSAHSLRVDMAQDLAADNLEIGTVMQAAGWTTPRMLAGYTSKLAAKRGAVPRYYSRRRR